MSRRPVYYTLPHYLSNLTQLSFSTGMVIPDLDVDFFPKNYTFIRQLEKKANSSSPTQRKRESKLNGDSPALSRRSETSPPNRLSKTKMIFQTATFRTSLNRLSKRGGEESLSALEAGNCKEHGRKLELVCIDHKCRICVSCALFGQHKGHDYRSEEDVLQEVVSRAERLIELFQNIEDNQNKSLDQAVQDQISTKFRERLNELTEQIHNTFTVNLILGYQWLLKMHYRIT